jgi:hypothetical protein
VLAANGRGAWLCTRPKSNVSTYYVAMTSECYYNVNCYYIWNIHSLHNIILFYIDSEYYTHVVISNHGWSNLVDLMAPHSLHACVVYIGGGMVRWVVPGSVINSK